MLYTVGEMAKLLGISSSTLRYYDREGLLPFVERSRGGIRMFTGCGLQHLDGNRMPEKIRAFHPGDKGIYHHGRGGGRIPSKASGAFSKPPQRGGKAAPGNCRKPCPCWNINAGIMKLPAGPAQKRQSTPCCRSKFRKKYRRAKKNLDLGFRFPKG